VVDPPQNDLRSRLLFLQARFPHLCSRLPSGGYLTCEHHPLDSPSFLSTVCAPPCLYSPYSSLLPRPTPLRSFFLRVTYQIFCVPLLATSSPLGIVSLPAHSFPSRCVRCAFFIALFYTSASKLRIWETLMLAPESTAGVFSGLAPPPPRLSVPASHRSWSSRVSPPLHPINLITTSVVPRMTMRCL